MGSKDNEHCQHTFPKYCISPSSYPLTCARTTMFRKFPSRLLKSALLSSSYPRRTLKFPMSVLIIHLKQSGSIIVVVPPPFAIRLSNLCVQTPFALNSTTTALFHCHSNRSSFFLAFWVPGTTLSRIHLHATLDGHHFIESGLFPEMLNYHFSARASWPTCGWLGLFIYRWLRK